MIRDGSRPRREMLHGRFGLVNSTVLVDGLVHNLTSSNPVLLKFYALKNGQRERIKTQTDIAGRHLRGSKRIAQCVRSKQKLEIMAILENDVQQGSTT